MATREEQTNLMDMFGEQERLDRDTVGNLDRAIAALRTAQRSAMDDKYGYQGSNPDIQGEWDKYNALERAKDAARGFTPTTQMPSGGGTPSSPSRTTGPRSGGSEGQRTRPPAPRSEGEPFGGANLSTVLSALALSPYQEDLRVTDRTRRPTPPDRHGGGHGGPLDGLMANTIDDLLGLMGIGYKRPQYDYVTEPVFRSPMAEIAYNSYNPYGVLFSDPVRTDTYPYYSARPEMIPRWSSGNRYGTWGGY